MHIYLCAELGLTFRAAFLAGHKSSAKISDAQSPIRAFHEDTNEPRPRRELAKMTVRQLNLCGKAEKRTPAASAVKTLPTRQKRKKPD